MAVLPIVDAQLDCAGVRLTRSRPVLVVQNISVKLEGYLVETLKQTKYVVMNSPEGILFPGNC